MKAIETPESPDGLESIKLLLQFYIEKYFNFNLLSQDRDTSMLGFIDGTDPLVDKSDLNEQDLQTLRQALEVFVEEETERLEIANLSELSIKQIVDELARIDPNQTYLPTLNQKTQIEASDYQEFLINLNQILQRDPFFWDRLNWR